MADTSRNAYDTSTNRYADQSTTATGWSGWVVFAAVMLLLVGIFQAMQGLVALFNKNYYLTELRHSPHYPNGQYLLVTSNLNTWGWVHLIIGIIAGLTGLGLLAGNMAARIVGVIIAAISALANLLFINASPVWSSIVIAVDVIAAFAIIAHGHELKSSTY